MNGLCGVVLLRAKKSVPVEVSREGWPCDSLIGLGGEAYVKRGRIGVVDRCFVCCREGRRLGSKRAETAAPWRPGGVVARYRNAITRRVTTPAESHLNNEMTSTCRLCACTLTWRTQRSLSGFWKGAKANFHPNSQEAAYLQKKRWKKYLRGKKKGLY